MKFLLERYPKQLLEKVAQNILYNWEIFFSIYFAPLFFKSG